MCEPEKRSRSSDHPDPMPDSNIIFDALETALGEPHAKGFLPLGSLLNADLNAALNIREKYLASLAQGGTPVLSGFSVKEPIASTGNG
jgi:hypothetical protein